MREITLTRGKVALVDSADFDSLNSRKWYAASCGGRFYAASRIDGHIVYMHRQIAKPGNLYVDHINGNSLDNRRDNLRACSSSENLANTRVSKANSSGFKGVYYSKARAKWIAQKRIDGRTFNLGGFDTAQQAALAYDEAAVAAFGQFALTNQSLGLL